MTEWYLIVVILTTSVHGDVKINRKPYEKEDACYISFFEDVVETLSVEKGATVVPICVPLRRESI